jgi:DNA-binding NarL/FixJ family response regulator
MGTRAPEARTRAVDVLVVDDQLPIREVVRRLVSLLPHWRVVGAVDNGDYALAAGVRCAPHVVLMDINLPGMSGIEATRRIVAISPGIRVVLLSTYAIHDLPADASTCDAVGYLNKEDLTPRRLRAMVDATG